MNKILLKNCPAAIFVAGMLALACGGCGNAGYRQGVSKANDELKAGSPCIYTTSMAEVGKTDPKTGLPFLVLESPETPELLDEIKGHNATIYSAYDAKGQLKP
ncbi:MAG TPA: hypothetical protein VFE47_00865 [Tepidisphaeraceae bacterium]|jgi:hypothetical protein|nr:hypothetical protein [Tepidisphaeraceae bacterium]